MKQPNIVYFVADQMRSDALAHHGNPASITPNIDDILRDGVSFENAYCQNPVCVPSRCSFLTGLYPHTTGHRTIHYLQNEGEPNFLRTMKSNGYEVIWIGRNDVIPGDRSKEEFCDAYYDGVHDEDMKYMTRQTGMKFPIPEVSQAQIETPGYYSFFVGKTDETVAANDHDWKCVRKALEYLDYKKENPGDKPFFLYVTLTYPHPPYKCEDPWYSSIDRALVEKRRPNANTLEGKPSMLKEISRKQNLDAWGEDHLNELRATYLAMVSRFDSQYGLVRDKLKALDFYDDTSIFVFSDHGDYTGDYSIAEKVQNCFDDPVANVPLIIKPAKQFNVKPRISKALVELVDLTETVCEMTGIQTEYVQFGKSLLGVLAQETEHKDAVFCEGGRIHGETWAMEKGHGPASPYYPRLSSQESEGPEHTKAVMIRMGNFKYVYRLYEQHEFYDLEKDPKELSNVIEQPEHQAQVQIMKNRILDWFVQTGDIVPNRKDIR